VSGIQTGRYAPGTWLRQEALAEQFEVSRTPVREALHQLEARGLVRLVPNQGALVCAPDARDVRESYEVRAELEGLAVELAVKWMTDHALLELRRAQARFAEAVQAAIAPENPEPPMRRSRSPSPGWVEANDVFHDVLIRTSGNRRLATVIQELHLGFIRNVMLLTATIDGRYMRENVAQHEAVLLAVERNDAAEARSAMIHHIKRSGEQMVRWLEMQHTMATDRAAIGHAP
jgi:DNA-binding GntR family transcriptional regulator